MLNFETIKYFNSNNKIEENNYLKNQGIFQACFNNSMINGTKNTFNIELPNVKIYNQDDSYLCWIYAYINFLKPSICQNLNIEDKDLDFSINYIHFFDRLEKTNTLYEKIINDKNNLQLPIQEYFLDEYIHTYGSFYNTKNIIDKYGIVPENIMPMNYNSYSPFTFNKILKEKVKQDIVYLLNTNDVDEQIKLKDKFLEENYILLSKVFGKPPISFDYSYQNTDNQKVEFNKITPLEFSKMCLRDDLDDFILVLNNESEEFYKEHTYDYFEQIYGNKTVYYNLPLNAIKASVIKHLKNGIPVWFGCDFTPVCGSITNKVGILDSSLFDYENILGVNLLSKSDSKYFNCCDYHHAMCITGVQIENGQPIRWKVLNSFGKENNQEGYFVMNDNYFNNYVTSFGLNKNLI